MVRKVYVLDLFQLRRSCFVEQGLHLFRFEPGETFRGLSFQLIAPAELHHAHSLEGGRAGRDLRLEREIWIVLSRRLPSQTVITRTYELGYYVTISGPIPLDPSGYMRVWIHDSGPKQG